MPNTQPNTLRPELEAVPIRMCGLPVHRGYPVPWFVDWIKDEEGNPVPEFRAMDPVKWKRAVREKLCWVCGHKLGAYLTFAIGPMCGVNRVSSEPPCHKECALWSARNCPFLSRPHMERREPDVPYLQPAGFMITRNPGVMLMWTTKTYTVFSDGKGGLLIEVGEPLDIQFWSQGRIATYEEIKESVETGLPLLREKAQGAEEEAQLQRLIDRFWTLVPVATA